MAKRFGQLVERIVVEACDRSYTEFFTRLGKSQKAIYDWRGRDEPPRGALALIEKKFRVPIWKLRSAMEGNNAPLFMLDSQDENRMVPSPLGSRADFPQEFDVHLSADVGRRLLGLAERTGRDPQELGAQLVDWAMDDQIWKGRLPMGHIPKR